MSPEDLACELISEGIVLRAWEIIERKSAMRGDGNSSMSGNIGQRNSKGSIGRSHNHHHNRNKNSHSRRSGDYSSILNDNANFFRICSESRKEKSLINKIQESWSY